MNFIYLESALKANSDASTVIKIHCFGYYWAESLLVRLNLRKKKSKHKVRNAEGATSLIYIIISVRFKSPGKILTNSPRKV